MGSSFSTIPGSSSSPFDLVPERVLLPPKTFPTVGVGINGEDEESLSAVGGVDVGSTEKCPRDAVPERGKVCGHDRETSSEMGPNVFEYHNSGSETGDGVSDPGPEVPGVIGALSFACVGERLAGVAGREKVDGLDSRPVDDLEVAEVRDVGVVVVQ